MPEEILEKWFQSSKEINHWMKGHEGTLKCFTTEMVVVWWFLNWFGSLRWRDGINHLHYTIIQEKVTSWLRYYVNDDTTKKLHSLWLKEKAWILRVVRNNRGKFMTDYWRPLTRFLPTSYLLKFYFSLPALLNIFFSTSSKTLHLRKLWSENLTKKTIHRG